MADSNPRIEIPLSEYNEMVDKIKSLEKTMVNLVDKTLEENRKIEELNENIEYLKSIPLLARIFHWKTLIKEV